MYKVMKQMYHRFSFLVCFLILILSGCRTYGGYDSEVALFDQVEESNSVFANELNKARGELQKLQQAAQQDVSMAPMVAEYEMLLEKHSHLVELHADLAATLEVKTGILGQLTPAYRHLNRVMGSIAVEQNAMKGQYYQFADRLINREDTGDMWAASIAKSRYQAVPPYYRAISHALDRKSVSAALDQAM